MLAASIESFIFPTTWAAERVKPTSASFTITPACPRLAKFSLPSHRDWGNVLATQLGSNIGKSPSYFRNLLALEMKETVTQQETITVRALLQRIHWTRLCVQTPRYIVFHCLHVRSYCTNCRPTKSILITTIEMFIKSICWSSYREIEVLFATENTQRRCVAWCQLNWFHWFTMWHISAITS